MIDNMTSMTRHGENTETFIAGISCCGSRQKELMVMGNNQSTVYGGGRRSSNSNRLTSTSEMKDTEAFLASEMNALSFQERNKAQEDVHCVGQELEEDDATVATKLQEFQVEVEIQKPKSPVYQFAERTNAQFVSNRTFRLKFLRANLYDVRKSVNQMMKFLQLKEQYFGRDKLCREIELSDLTDEDRAYMRKGAFHIPDQRDSFGRAIVQMMNSKIGLGTAVNVVSGTTITTTVERKNTANFLADRGKFECLTYVIFGCIITLSLETKIRVSYHVWWNLLIPLEEAQLKG